MLFKNTLNKQHTQSQWRHMEQMEADALSGFIWQQHANEKPDAIYDKGIPETWCLAPTTTCHLLSHYKKEDNKERRPFTQDHISLPVLWDKCQLTVHLEDCMLHSTYCINTLNLPQDCPEVRDQAWMRWSRYFLCFFFSSFSYMKHIKFDRILRPKQ